MILEFSDDLDLKKIADSGQCFRWEELPDGGFRVPHKDSCLIIRKLSEDSYELSCSEDEYECLWKDYLDADTGYRSIRGRISKKKDPFLYAAAEDQQGIRILKQDVFETVISYIISQRRSIPSITTCVDRLSELCGTKIKVPKLEEPFVKPLKDSYYAFPTVKQASKLTAEELNGIGAGYRTAYIIAATEDFNSGKLRPEGLASLSDDDLYTALTSMYGVGTKVANCVMLFGFHRVGRFPVDVWIKRIEDKYYGGHFDAEQYPDTAGILQQFMFYYIRKGTVD